MVVFDSNRAYGSQLETSDTTSILGVLTTQIKPNPPKDGDGKPRILASFEKPRKTPPKAPKIAGLLMTAIS
jgi:hypothetical protein